MPMTAPRATPADLTRRIAIETPESVVIELELAGIGSRFAAAFADMILLVLLLLAAVLGLSLLDLEGGLGAWTAAVFILLGLLIFWGYFALCEGLLNGQTPGKRSVGIRVVMDTGHPVTFGAAVSRNLLRLVDSQPAFLYFAGSLFIFFHPLHKRLGDIVAGTIVVRDRPTETRLSVAAGAEPLVAPGVGEAPELADDEFQVLEQFLARRDGFDEPVRARVAQNLVRRFAERLPRGSVGVEGRLEALFAHERARRGGAMAAAVKGRGGASAATARFIARKQESWERFRAAATLAEKGGLKHMDGEALTVFAARYREAAADLARARTYGVDARVLAGLERAVSAGHNALYGLRGVTGAPLRRLALRDLPAAVWAARAYVLAAFLLTFVPAVGGYVLIREQPERAAELLPDAMIARAEAGVAESRAGVGYAQMPSPFLPIMASSIIANNIQVAIAAFALGITAGVGTVWVLFFNGLLFGSIVGLFANYGLAGWLLTFVAGHGVLELTAIFISGAAGLRIAHALLSPGDVPRRDALVVAGRASILLFGFATLLLVLAGIIEGLLSASDAPAMLKVGVSAASALLLVLFAIAGKRAATNGRGDAGT